MNAEWQWMCRCINNQEVGLEAATLERVRNSSLVEGLRADNVAGLKHTAEAVDAFFLREERVVGERSAWSEAQLKRWVDRAEVRIRGMSMRKGG
jgi:hypothetical protein